MRRKYDDAIAILFAIAIVSVVAAGLIRLVLSAPDRHQVVRYRVIRVHEGETLWQIAMRNRRPDQRLQAQIYEIRQVNGLVPPLDYIHPGQRLVIPIRE